MFSVHGNLYPTGWGHQHEHGCKSMTWELPWMISVDEHISVYIGVCWSCQLRSSLNPKDRGVLCSLYRFQKRDLSWWNLDLLVWESRWSCIEFLSCACGLGIHYFQDFVVLENDWLLQDHLVVIFVLATSEEGEIFLRLILLLLLLGFAILHKYEWNHLSFMLSF